MIREATATKVRKNLGELLNEVQYRRDSVLITPVYESEELSDAETRLQTFTRDLVPVLDRFSRLGARQGDEGPSEEEHHFADRSGDHRLVQVQGEGLPDENERGAAGLS